MRYLFLLLFFSTSAISSFAQADSIRLKNIFQTITTEVSRYKLDTTLPPDDKLTKKIIELRQLRGGFNINEAIAFKQQEELKENKISKEDYSFFQQQFSVGNGRKWLDNATIHIYRQHFSYREIKKLVKFYRTSAGQKMANDFGVIMLKTLMAAQFIHDALLKKNKL